MSSVGFREDHLVEEARQHDTQNVLWTAGED